MRTLDRSVTPAAGLMTSTTAPNSSSARMTSGMWLLVCGLNDRARNPIRNFLIPQTSPAAAAALTGISDTDHVRFPLALLSERRDAPRPQSGHSCSVTGTVLEAPAPLIAQVPWASQRRLPASETRGRACSQAGLAPSRSCPTRSCRIPRELRDARNDLLKQRPCQVASASCRCYVKMSWG